MSTLTTFKFDEQLTRTLEELKNSSSASSKSEVVRRAITLLKLVQDAATNGEKLVLRKEDDKGQVIKEREIIIS